MGNSHMTVEKSVHTIVTMLATHPSQPSLSHRFSLNRRRRKRSCAATTEKEKFWRMMQHEMMLSAGASALTGVARDSLYTVAEPM